MHTHVQTISPKHHTKYFSISISHTQYHTISRQYHNITRKYSISYIIMEYVLIIQVVEFKITAYIHLQEHPATTIMYTFVCMHLCLV